MRLPLFLGILLAALPLPARDYELARHGRTRMVVVVPPAPTASEELAARELTRYISQMTSAALEIRKGGQIPPDAVVLAEAPRFESLGLGMPIPELGQEGYALLPGAGNLIVVGARGRALLNATYDLLDRAGCRWLAPELSHYRGAAQIVPRASAASVSLSKPVVRRPNLAYRKLYVEEGHSHTVDNLLQMIEWMPKVGYNTLVIPTDYQGSGRVRWDAWRQKLTPELERRDLIIEVGGHGYQNFLSAQMEGGRLYAEHPEWFGQDGEGKRRKEKSWVFCTSNPAAVDYLTSNVLGYLRERPEIDIFDFWPPDGAKWCECPECAKLGSPSNRQAILLKQIQPRVRAARPDLRLEVLAYSTSITPPERETLDESIHLDFCPISQHFWTQIDDRQSTQNAHYVDGLKAWREKFAGEISIYSYYRKYAWDSLPVVFPRYIQKDLQFYGTIPVQGISTYAEPGDWFTFELNHYILAELGKDVNADVEALVRKFCQARYGPAAEQAAAVVSTLEKIVPRYCSLPGTPLKSPEELTRAAAEIRTAREPLGQFITTAASDESLSWSLTRLGYMCDYAEKDLALRALHASKAPRPQIETQGAALREFLLSHGDDGLFLVSNNRLTLSRVLGHYGIDRKKRRD